MAVSVGCDVLRVSVRTRLIASVADPSPGEQLTASRDHRAYPDKRNTAAASQRPSAPTTQHQHRWIRVRPWVEPPPTKSGAVGLSLDGTDVRGLRAFWALGGAELYPLTFVE
jgi:hypothetical protein